MLRLPGTANDAWARILGNDCRHVNDMAPDDPLVLTGRRAGEMYTRIVDELRTGDYCRHPAVIDLFHFIYLQVNQQQAVIALHDDPARPTIHFGMARAPLPIGEKVMILGVLQAPTIYIPLDWAEQFEREPVMVRAGVLFTGSQLRDFFHGKLTPSQQSAREMLVRASAFEAEFVRELAARRGYEPNEHHRRLLDAFPEGIASLPAGLWYESEPFERLPIQTPPERFLPSGLPR